MNDSIHLCLVREMYSKFHNLNEMNFYLKEKFLILLRIIYNIIIGTYYPFIIKIYIYRYNPILIFLMNILSFFKKILDFKMFNNKIKGKVFYEL